MTFCIVNDSLIKHLAEEDRMDSMNSRLDRYTEELLKDIHGNYTVRDDSQGIEDEIDRLVLMLAAGPVSDETMVACRVFREKFLLAARRVAQRQIDADDDMLSDGQDTRDDSFCERF